MGKKMSVITDTDILIKAYRGDEDKIKNLVLLKDKSYISVVTAIESMTCTNTFRQLASFNKFLKIYHIIHISEFISLLTFKIFRQYTAKHHFGLADYFIAATSLKHKLQL